MSVLIKGMEMPKDCLKCVFYRKADPIYDYCCISSVTPKRHIPDDCPLVSIPSHGRMIDADALLNLLNNCMFPSDMVTTMAVRMATNWIKEAQTILEAEEAE